MNKTLYLVSILPLLIYIAILMLIVEHSWVITMLSIGLAYGSLSYLISIRKLYYLAEASPHIALFIFTLSIIITGFYGLESFLLSITIGIFTITLLGLTTGKTRDLDKSLSLLIGLSSSFNVLALYSLLKTNPRGLSFTTIFIGDPLLTTTREAYVSLAIALFTLTTITVTLREQLIISIDRDFAKISSIKTWLYDSLAYATLAINTIGLLRITGFILQHVLALLPSVAISMIKKSLWESYLLTIVSTTYIALASLNVSILLGVPPSGIIGLAYIVYFIIIYLKR
uniref:Metal ABC transporter permease n=1 Tax=Staphylothermus marinus TaxID=2280 RepID=A0A7C4D7H5_STAMA